VTINQELAQDILTVINMLPNVHDQNSWFYVYEGNKTRLTPEDIHMAQLLKEAKEGDEKGISYREFEPSVPCNATLCVAGWACIMNGYELVIGQDEDGAYDTYAVKDDEHVGVFRKGQELLGISKEVADWLFCETNDVMATEALSDLSEGRIPDMEMEYDDSDHYDY